MHSPGDSSQPVPIYIQCDIVSKVLGSDTVSPKPMVVGRLNKQAGSVTPFWDGARAFSLLLSTLVLNGLDGGFLQTRVRVISQN